MEWIKVSDRLPPDGAAVMVTERYQGLKKPPERGRFVISLASDVPEGE